MENIKTISNSDEPLKAEKVSKACSLILYGLGKKGVKVRNEDVFQMVRLALTGCHASTSAILSVGEICEALGEETVKKRLEGLIELVEEL